MPILKREWAAHNTQEDKRMAKSTDERIARWCNLSLSFFSLSALHELPQKTIITIYHPFFSFSSASLCSCTITSTTPLLLFSLSTPHLTPFLSLSVLFPRSFFFVSVIIPIIPIQPHSNSYPSIASINHPLFPCTIFWSPLCISIPQPSLPSLFLFSPPLPSPSNPLLLRHRFLPSILNSLNNTTVKKTTTHWAELCWRFSSTA